MPKIKIEIEVSGEEIVGIISQVARSEDGSFHRKSYARYKFNDFSKANNPYQARPKQPLRKKKPLIERG